MDTIFAQASAIGRAGVAVLRVSGPLAFDVVESMAGRVPEPRRASLSRLTDQNGALLDEALVLCFEEGQSFTGERVSEFHLHGSVAIVAAVLRHIGQMEGLRLASPGEFTRRALENGRLDLTRVEALSDLIDAETEAQRIQAGRLFTGGLAEKISNWRETMIQALALLEATIDFADEEIPYDVTGDVRALLENLTKELEAEIAGSYAAEQVRTGFEVALVGPPNAGKSTLLNRIAGREAAITSEVAGTTRDVIEVRMDIDGLAVTFLDTAGLREAADEVEAIGINRGRDRASQADLRVYLVDETHTSFEKAAPDDLVRVTKVDLTGRDDGISGLTGFGVDKLLKDVSEILSSRASGAGLINRQRHREALSEGVCNLRRALEVIEQGPDFYEISGEELRLAIRSLDVIIGHVDVEDLLGEIFSNFCVGK